MTDDSEITDPRDPYKQPDIVVELDRWLAVWPNHLAGSIDVAVIQRARYEIVALRRTIRLGPDLPAHARIEALEEAARVADGYCTDRTDDVARGIRALKDKRHD